MAAERQSPDVLLDQTNLSGAVTAIQDDPDAPDASWLTAISNNADSICRTSFPIPTGNPTIGVDLQEFRVLVGKLGGTGTPTARVELYENGVLIRAGSENNVTGNLVISFTWNANELATPNGSQVECRVYGTKSGGSPTARATVEVGAVEWNVTYSAGVTHLGAATLSGVGAVAGIGVLILSGLATLAGSGLVTAIGRGIYTGKATLSGVGTVSAIGRAIYAAKSVLSGVGTVACIGTVGGVIQYGVATLSGVGSIVASAVATFAGKTTISGSGTVAAIGQRIVYGIATLAGVGSLSGIGRLILAGKAALTGSGLLVAILTKVGAVTPILLTLISRSFTHTTETRSQTLTLDARDTEYTG